MTCAQDIVRSSFRPLQAFIHSIIRLCSLPMAEKAKIDIGHNESEPWNEWDIEMPSCCEEVKCTEYEALNSHNNLRQILTEVRSKVFQMALQTFKDTKNGGILLSGGKSSTFSFYDNDTLISNFRQEPFFRYLFGCNEPDLMELLDLSKKEIILFVEPLPLEAERWIGPRKAFSHYIEEYALSDALPLHSLKDTLKERRIETLYLLHGRNSDSDLYTMTTATFDGIKEFTLDYCSLHPLLCEARTIKTKTEIVFMRTANLVSSKAHVFVMRHIKPKMSERQLEALFKGFTYFYGGARHQAYECICGSGRNGSILHYGHAAYPNDKILADGESVVLDMGSEYLGYCTDITCSYPINGKFTKQQQMIHEAVLDANRSVMNAMKPGVIWSDMHRLAERVLLKHLHKRMKILVNPLGDGKNENEEQAIDYFMAHFVCSMFMPHGLGHFLGLTVHDVGGYTDEYAPSQELGLCWLRTTRMLKEGMVITVEPGLYFNESWMRQMMQKYPKMAECVDEEVISEYYGCGGCRIEDNVLITMDGIENFTIVPRTCKQIEKVMKVSKLK